MPHLLIVAHCPSDNALAMADAVMRGCRSDLVSDVTVERTVPLQRWQTPEDIAAAAIFLASPRAQNITGQTINVDGGQVMH